LQPNLHWTNYVKACKLIKLSCIEVEEGQEKMMFFKDRKFFWPLFWYKLYIYI